MRIWPAIDITGDTRVQLSRGKYWREACVETGLAGTAAVFDSNDATSLQFILISKLSRIDRAAIAASSAALVSGLVPLLIHLAVATLGLLKDISGRFRLLKNIHQLSESGAPGCIIGTALYDGNVGLADPIAAGVAAV